MRFSTVFLNPFPRQVSHDRKPDKQDQYQIPPGFPHNGRGRYRMPDSALLAGLRGGVTPVTLSVTTQHLCHKVVSLGAGLLKSMNVYYICGTWGNVMFAMLSCLGNGKNTFERCFA